MQSKYQSFNGKNSLSSKTLFNERLKYEIGLIEQNPEDLESPDYEFKDDTQIIKPMKKFFVGEYQYYGKVNESLQSIIPKKDKLKPISQQANLFALDFVQRQYKLLTETFTKCATIGTISKDDRFLSVLKPVKAFKLLNNEYDSYMSNIISNFNLQINKNNAFKILNFENYMDSLLLYNNINAQTSPMTKTGFVKSKKCPMNISGFVIEIAELEYSNDSQKYNFTQSPNFDFFLKACIKHGFSIDYHSPWRLIADIDSPPMLESMASLGYKRETIFQSHFDSVVDFEIDNIKTIFYNGYNTFIKNRPIEKLVFECNKKLKSEIITRQQINKGFIENVITNSEALKIYIKMRANEQNVEISKQNLSLITSKSISQYNNLGINEALNYVENEIKLKELVGSGAINSLMISYENRLKG